MAFDTINEKHIAGSAEPCMASHSLLSGAELIVDASIRSGGGNVLWARRHQYKETNWALISCFKLPQHKPTKTLARLSPSSHLPAYPRYYRIDQLAEGAADLPRLRLCQTARCKGPNVTVM